MLSRALTGAALAAALAVSACATSEDVVPVPYTASAAARVPGAESIAVTVAGTDARTENRARIGVQINGYGMDMAAIRATEEVSDIVKNAIAAELAQRGYNVGTSGARVNATVETFFNEFESGMWAGKSIANVAMTVTVTGRNGQQVYSRRVTGRAERSVQIANGGNAATTLSQALSQATETLMADAAFTAALAR
ncbi:YajG family lipoprotein [Brevundimonas sp.]